MQATEIDFTAQLSLRTTWRYTPQGGFMLVLTGCHAAVAFDAALCITNKFHPAIFLFLCVLRAPDVTDRRFGFLHHRDAVVAVGRLC
jgi:hypothetical protein